MTKELDSFYTAFPLANSTPVTQTSLKFLDPFKQVPTLGPFHTLFLQCSYPRNPLILLLHFLQDSAQIPPFQKSIPWPSYLKDYSFSSCSMSLTCFVYWYIFICFPSPTLHHGHWVIVFSSLLPKLSACDSAKPPTTVQCSRTSHVACFG